MNCVKNCVIHLPMHCIEGFDRLTVRISPDYIDTAAGNRAGEASRMDLER